MQIEVSLSDADVERIAQRVAELIGSNHRPADGDQLPKLLTEPEAAAQLGVSKFSLKKWREEGYIPSHTSRRPILYSADNLREIASWMASR